MIDSFLCVSTELKSIINLTVFNSIMLNMYIKINNINRKNRAFRATFKWAFNCDIYYYETKIRYPNAPFIALLL